jgi:hypothetical protein
MSKSSLIDLMNQGKEAIRKAEALFGNLYQFQTEETKETLTAIMTMAKCHGAFLEQMAAVNPSPWENAGEVVVSAPQAANGATDSTALHSKLEVRWGSVGNSRFVGGYLNLLGLMRNRGLGTRYEFTVSHPTEPHRTTNISMDSIGPDYFTYKALVDAYSRSNQAHKRIWYIYDNHLRRMHIASQEEFDEKYIWKD